MEDSLKLGRHSIRTEELDISESLISPTLHNLLGDKLKTISYYKDQIYVFNFNIKYFFEWHP